MACLFFILFSIRFCCFGWMDGLATYYWLSKWKVCTPIQRKVYKRKNSLNNFDNLHHPLEAC